MYVCGRKWITMGISLDSGDNSGTRYIIGISIK